VLILRFCQKLGDVGDSHGQGLRWQVIGHSTVAYDDQLVAAWREAWKVGLEDQPPAAPPSAPAPCALAAPALAASASAAPALAAAALAAPAPAALALAASAPAVRALAALAPAALPEAASSSSAVGPAVGQQSQAPLLQELVALKFLRHDKALQDGAKAYSSSSSWVALGKGSFGEVFAGTRTADNHPVAIKRLKSIAGNDFKKIVAEAVVLDRLRGHPHVVQLLDAFALGKQMHLVLGHGGRSLDEMVQARPSMAQIRSVAAHLNDALAFVHSIGLVHADLKPANVVVAAVGRTWTCKLADFGNALEARDQLLQGAGGWVGGCFFVLFFGFYLVAASAASAAAVAVATAAAAAAAVAAVAAVAAAVAASVEQ
jgi:uncharacterized membrane protein YccF (DUF307 family)